MNKKNWLCALVAMAGASLAQAQTQISIDHEAPIGTIQPEVYGQFVEHLGTQIYNGIWVGEDSDIPNTDGIRDDVFAALDALDIPVMRWPGGCYAYLYHWRDGIGPRDQRSPRVNVPWGGTAESNQFGTHEFFDLAERLGAKTYLNINLGTGTPGESADWLEYITLERHSALSAERRANGRDQPWKVDYLTIGNETWGCGGHMRPEYYADLYAHWMTFAKTAGEQPRRVISGSHDANISYSDELIENLKGKPLSEGISLHFYTLPTQDWSDKGPGTGFGEDHWASTLKRTLEMDRLIREQLAMFERHGLPKDFGLYIDEWGAWVNTPEGAPALWQQNTIREAVLAALNFNIFHAHADRVPMTNIAQMVNVLQAMILTDGPRMVLTPTYHAYHMYKPFQGATALPVSLDGPEYRHGDIAFPALSATAALTAAGALLVALVNADAGKAHAVRFDAGESSSVSARQLSGAGLDAHNDFDHPQQVQPQDISLQVRSGVVSLELPPRSVSVLRLE
jgi:alpha-N-arabinofuranosidase